MTTQTLDAIDLGTTDPRVIAVALRGRLTVEDMAGLMDRIEAIHANGDKALLYLDITGYTGFQAAVVKEKLAHMSTLWNGIERAAYIVDRSWMATMMPLVDAVTPMHVRAFGVDETDAARTWVLSGE